MKAIFTLFLFAFILSSQAQVIRYVRAGGTGDGSAWQFATGNLQNAINASAPGDEVWVGAGEYKPTSPITDPLNLGGALVNRYSTFTMKSGVKVYGSFPATGNPGMDDRDFSNHETILSGDIGVVNDSTDNCFHVVFFPNINSAVLDGFVIKHGNADANGSNGSATSYIPSLMTNINNYYGGAVYLTDGSLNTIANCAILYNTATYNGGAVFISSGNHIFDNNLFEQNLGGGYGGAIYNTLGNHSFNGNTFVNNRVKLQSGGAFPMPTPAYYANGGAIASVNGSSNFTNNVFLDNIASVTLGTTNSQGGAVYIDNGNNTLSNNLFSGNRSLYLPSGVQVSSGGALCIISGSSTVKDNGFENNITHGSGGAISILLGNHTVYRNLFSGNESVGNGGAILFSSTQADIFNNLFIDNASTSGNGGALHSSFNNGTNLYVNNTFYGNSAGTSGGAVYLDNRVDHFYNNIFWNNDENTSASASPSDITSFNSASSTSFHNLFQLGSVSNGNLIGQNPLFTDPSSGDFSLQAGSPCINAGNNDYFLSTYGTTDIEGNARIYGNTIDMGAIENQGEIEPISITEFQTPIDLRVFPNPVQMGEFLTVEAVGYQSFNIIDLYGKQILSGKLNEGSNALNIDQLVPGFYMLQTETNTVRFIKN